MPEDLFFKGQSGKDIFKHDSRQLERHLLSDRLQSWGANWALNTG